ncbi:3-deoxy-D-manno-octulosonate 8-phosphate phosphatase [Adhaeribacter aerolatus]|uniref:3-deoxy-D-manno-octulosonate 8-phosphate phosphatase n=1 Tax=Adhaeribacter aerolatus TaxID=670289 RepID=A0A512B059_9BACT|nr:3-deoxy-D-manno-octulosonate 8-phosphate phosphatase [Adhaeribacter aerolatus]GEO05342.1 3-deoxy-D-manno-octulosonate 8-phosphate phosphatase [Adhaeribacter aerolatus]
MQHHPSLDLTRVKAFIFDVDGVLTDGSLLALASGEQVRSFHIKDGFAIRHAIQKGYRVAIISARQEEGVRKRLLSLDVEDIYLGVSNKLEAFGQFLTKYSLQPADIAYMGDDIPDLAVMQQCGVAACPEDAAPDVMWVANYISGKPGGKGAVRELIEAVLKMQGTW